MFRGLEVGHLYTSIAIAKISSLNFNILIHSSSSHLSTLPRRCNCGILKLASNFKNYKINFNWRIYIKHLHANDIDQRLEVIIHKYNIMIDWPSLTMSGKQ